MIDGSEDNFINVVRVNLIPIRFCDESECVRDVVLLEIVEFLHLFRDVRLIEIRVVVDQNIDVIRNDFGHEFHVNRSSRSNTCKEDLRVFADGFEIIRKNIFEFTH